MNDLAIGRSPIAAVRWLFFPTVLLLSCVTIIAGVLVTQALSWYLVLPVALFMLSISGLVIYISYTDWHDETYSVLDGVLEIRYRTLMRYMTTRRGPISQLQSVWVVRRGVWKMLFNFGDVYIQVGWARRPFVMRDVQNPYDIRERLEILARVSRNNRTAERMDAFDTII